MEEQQHITESIPEPKNEKAKPEKAAPISFSGYQKFMIVLLALLQFTIILDSGIDSVMCCCSSIRFLFVLFFL